MLFRSRNRTIINTANGPLVLSVPLSIKGNRIPLGAVTIDNTSGWARQHWRAIESAYRKAPFFEHYETGLRTILQSGTNLLFDLNQEILSFCLNSIGWKKKLSKTLTYGERPPIYELADFRDILRARAPWSARNHYRPYPYYQVFGNGFAGNLAVIDLIFCCGPSASQILLKSAVNSNA